MEEKKPLAIDLYCGLGGWTDGLLAEGWDVIGFDIERHSYGGHCYPAPLVLQDVRSLDGAQLAGAALIVASSPCQEFSYRAMPWKRAKILGPPLLGLELFAQAFRIQREAIAAAGHFIPMVQENVRGANPWVRGEFGRSRWSYGSYHLWGDVPALMPMTLRGERKSRVGSRDPARANFVGTGGKGWDLERELPDHMKVGELNWRDYGRPGYKGDQMQDVAARQADDSVKCGGSAGDDWFTHHNRPEFEDRATNNSGGSWFNVAHNRESGTGQNPDGRLEGISEGRKGYASGTGNLGNSVVSRTTSSKSSARKAASARIAKIPFALASHIARVYKP